MTTDTESPKLASLPTALIAESITGLVLGAVMGLLTGVACAVVLHWTGLDNQLGMGSLGVTLYVGLVGLAFGVAAGVAIAGRLLKQGGSFWLALVGAMVAILLTSTLTRLGLLSDFETQLAATVIISLALALLGYNLRRNSTG